MTPPVRIIGMCGTIVLAVLVGAILVGVSVWYMMAGIRMREVQDQEYVRQKYQSPPPKCECPKVEEVDSGIDSGVSDVDLIISESRKAREVRIAENRRTTEYLSKWISKCDEDRVVYKSLLELCNRRVEERCRKEPTHNWGDKCNDVIEELKEYKAMLGLCEDRLVKERNERAQQPCQTEGEKAEEK